MTDSSTIRRDTPSARAISGGANEEAVLILSIGPVQEFIASGRKCRDLWFGSWLLSDLSRVAAETIQNRCGKDALVFPGALAEAALSRQTNVANRIVAIVRTPGEVARQAVQAVNSRLKALAKEILIEVGREDARRAVHFDEAAAREQIADLIECTWAFAPISGQDGYARARKEAERLSAARKNTKLWGQPPWSSETRKSSLDGVRESVLQDALYDALRAGKNDEKLRRCYRIHSSERLCGVGLLKRFGHRSDDAEGGGDVFSTPHVAALPFLDGLRSRPKARTAFKAYIEALEGLDRRIVKRLAVVPGKPHEVSDRIDASLLFPSLLAEAIEETVPKADWQSVQDQALRALAELYTAAGEPSPYFAVLLGDGDFMGRAIDRLEQPTEHKRFSQVLERFAQSAKGTVEQHGGALVYSGGDDVLAFLPVHRVIECAETLSSDFRDQLKDFSFDEDGVQRAPTFSMGVVLAHALVPLEDTLREVRSAEKAAKAVPEKDALCLRVIKRGGEAVSVSDKTTKLLQWMRRFLDWQAHGLLSSKAQYELMQLEQLSRHPAVGAAENELVQTLVANQTARLLARKRESGGEAVASDTLRRDAEHAIEELGGPATLGRALYVASVIAKARNQAEPPSPDGVRSTSVSSDVRASLETQQ